MALAAFTLGQQILAVILYSSCLSLQISLLVVGPTTSNLWWLQEKSSLFSLLSFSSCCKGGSDNFKALYMLELKLVVLKLKEEIWSFKTTISLVLSRIRALSSLKFWSSTLQNWPRNIGKCRKKTFHTLKNFKVFGLHSLVSYNVIFPLVVSAS